MAHPCLWVDYGVHQRHSFFLSCFFLCRVLLALRARVGWGRGSHKRTPLVTCGGRFLFSTRLVILVCVLPSLFGEGILNVGLVWLVGGDP